MKRFSVPTMLAGGLLAAAWVMPAWSADMTHERALRADSEPQNWLLHHQNYQGHRYARLNQINRDNVRNLKAAFTFALSGFQSGGRYAHGNLEATPIVDDGMMYVTDGWGSVYAVDVKAGNKAQIRWKMDPGTDRAWAGDVACCGVNNRGVGLWKDKIVSIVLDGRVVLLNRATGEVVWERKVADPAIAETLTVAPLILRDHAIVGSAGAEFGIRGWIDATDLNTGKQAWRRHTIPGKGEPGNETWGGESWVHGGGSIWVTGTYDPDTDLQFWGIGNPGPDWDAEYRPGDNLWASSVIALDKDGNIKWGFQYTPNDPYDYDEIGEHPVVDVTINGQARKTIVHAGRNGFFYTLDRTNGQFIVGKQYTDKLNWTTGLDPKTGRPLNYDPTKKVQPYAPGAAGTRANPRGYLCPGIAGGKNWQPSAYIPDQMVLVIPGIEGCSQIDTVEQKHMVDQGGTVKWRERFTGGGITWPERINGSIKNVDVRTGEMKAKLALPHPNYSGVLATSGGLVFTAHYDGTITAHNSETLQQLWSWDFGTPVNAPPMTYSVNGKQYLAIMVGSRMSPAIIKQSPELTHMSTASMVYVFTL